MPYKVFYNQGSDADFYNACRPVAGAPLNQVYRCCMASCGDSSICPELCTNIYPGTIVEDCSYQSGCWNSGYFNKQCTQNRAREIQACCKAKCARGEFSSIPGVNEAIDPANIDCADYCKGYEIIDG